MILAHGVGGRADLPLPVWLFAYSAAFALAISFVALRILWHRPLLARAAEGNTVPGPLDSAVRGVGLIGQIGVLALFALTLAAAWFGVDSVAFNLAPTALYVVFWVGLQVASALLGDVWRRINPLWTLAAMIERLRGYDPETSTATRWWASHWPAAAGLAAFLWLELAFHQPASLIAVAVFLILYTGAMLTAASTFGAAWLRTGDGFAVLFTLLAALSPLYRDDQGQLRVRIPGSGLATVEPRPGTMAVILLVLGATSFDGVARTQWWADIVGTRRDWALTTVNTLGMATTIAVVAAAFLGASRLIGVLADDDTDLLEQARRWAPSLIPIVLAYSIAHYFSLLVFEGQSFLRLLSDPLGEGWNLFGTADRAIDYTAVSANQIAYVQVAAIVIGHIGGVVAAHDRAIERYHGPTASTSQYPLLAAMIAYTVSGLLLLLNA